MTDDAPSLFSVLYDDGDSETNAKGEYIRRVGASKADAAAAAAEVAVIVPQQQAAPPQITTSPPAAPTTAVAEPAAAPAASAAPAPAEPAGSSTAAPIPSAPPPIEMDRLGVRGVDCEGKVLVLGDKVEAKFKVSAHKPPSFPPPRALRKHVHSPNTLTHPHTHVNHQQGKGSKYYPGRISAVHPPAAEGVGSLFSILYDDGDSESAAKSEYIRRVGASKVEEAAALPTPPPSAAESPTATAASAAAPAPPTSDAALPPPQAAATPAVTASSTASSIALDQVQQQQQQPQQSKALHSSSPITAPTPAPVAVAAVTASTATAPPPSSSSSSSSSSSLLGASFLPTALQSSAAFSFSTPQPQPQQPQHQQYTTPAAAPSPSPAAISTPLPASSAPLSASLLGFTPAAAATAPPAPLAAPFMQQQQQPIAAMGRLARELAAVRFRARPALFEAFASLSRARMLSSGAGAVASLAATPPSELANWVLASLVSAQASAAMGSSSSSSSSSTSTSASSLATLAAGSAGAPLIGSLALKDGLKRVGFSASKEALETLRSAFRLRDAALAGETGGHAAIRADLVAAYLCMDDYAAAPILERVDAESCARSGKAGHARPPRPPPFPSGGLGLPAAAAAAALGGLGAGAAVETGYSTPVGQGTPARAHYGSSGGGGAGALAASLVSGRPPAMAPWPAQHSGSASGGFFGGGAAAATAAAAPSPALNSTVGEWIRRQATQGERENLVAFMGLVADFQVKHGLHNNAPSGAAALAATGDSLVVPLGPSLRVGIRLYIP